MKLVAWSLVLVLAVAAGSADARETSEVPEPGQGNGEQNDSQSMSDKDQWACEVAMCLSNPSGPTAVSECKPPIDKMHRELAKGEKIPHCKFLDGGDNTGGGTGGGGRDDDTPPKHQL